MNFDQEWQSIESFVQLSMAFLTLSIVLSNLSKVFFKSIITLVGDKVHKPFYNSCTKKKIQQHHELESFPGRL